MYIGNDERAVLKKLNPIKLCQENISVFDCVYQTSRDMLHSYACLLTQCTTKAEDIVQDVFLSIWLKKEELSGIKDLKAYLYAITRNKVIDHMRRSQKEQCILKELSWLKEEGCCITEEMLLQKEYINIIYKAMSCLSPRQKLVFSLGKLYKWRHREIAATMGISTYTVRAHMSEATKTIKKQLHQNKNWKIEIDELLADK